MAATPDGSVVDEVNSGEDDPVTPRGAGRDDRGEQGTSPTHNGQCSDGNPGSGAGACLHGGYIPEPPKPIDQLVAALRDAGFNTTPDVEDIMDLIQTQEAMRIEEDLKSKSLLQFLKDYQVKDLMHIC